MKVIGLIGGMSWESSAIYYQTINKKVNGILGRSHSAKTIMYSVDFEVIAKLQQENNWDELALTLINAAQALENAGAQFIVLCTNTMHKVADRLVQNINLPFLHIGDATAEAIKKHGLQKVGLLGTRFTMEEDFLRSHLSGKFQIETLIPEKEERELIHSIIYNELVKGIIRPESRAAYLNIINNLLARGAEGIILGCTEIGLLVTEEHTSAILFDTASIHAEMAVKYSFQ